ncbi:uncharacterized protein LOC125371066 [Ricinus communis]|uniref:uncharacterized protein LOC125371066 n=1 Tax=Ricinus communis TaxID=3988 RepID=UPI00201B0CE1|nr:uncharacterized protein LOC125371066 [Ricinus communis]XP_048234873.1 uncharacterized protein LOC125371066 [Ricinus communis]
MGREPIRQWHQLVFIMTQKYVPPEYKNEMRLKIALARQGTQTPLEFFAQLEDLYFKAGMSVTLATVRTKFLHGLPVDLREEIDVLPIKDLTALAHAAQKVHFKLVRKKVYPWLSASSVKRYNSNPSPKFPTNSNANVQPRSQAPISGWPTRPIETPKLAAAPSQLSYATRQDKTSDRVCYKCGGRGHIVRDCPNPRKVLFSQATGYESFDDEEDNDEDLRTVYDDLTNEEPYACGPPDLNEGTPLSLVARRALTVKDASVGDQRENLFHTRCLVGTSSLSVIIDSGSCCNILNEKVVRVLNLPTSPHPQPYSLQWISEGRPWQYDKKTVHDGFFNTYTFQHKGRRVTLLPMTPQEIIHDHVERDRIKALEQTKEAIKPMATTGLPAFA